MRPTGIRKLYYSISEVSKIAGLEQYVLRYWETEFAQLKPAKNRAGNRIYTNKDIKFIFEIRRLLRDEKYTIEGAKKLLANYQPEPEGGEQLSLIDMPPKKRIQDQEVKAELIEVRDFLVEFMERLK
jgi:DNA-binding transcriptional MerR regulator